MEVTVEAEFCYAHRLLAHPGKCRRLHGHNVRVEVTASTPELDESGMVIDYDDLKKPLRGLLERWDHRTLLDKADPLVGMFREQGLGDWLVVFPHPTTAEHMARLIAAQMPLCRRVRYWETPTCSATWERGDPL